MCEFEHRNAAKSGSPGSAVATYAGSGDRFGWLACPGTRRYGPQAPLGRELVTNPTLSYIDAGSGSLLLQAIVGGVAAAGVMTKVYWKRFRRFLHIEKPEDESSTTG
jgi:hypothetical protein